MIYNLGLSGNLESIFTLILCIYRIKKTENDLFDTEKRFSVKSDTPPITGDEVLKGNEEDGSGILWIT